MFSEKELLEMERKREAFMLSCGEALGFYENHLTTLCKLSKVKRGEETTKSRS